MDHLRSANRRARPRRPSWPGRLVALVTAIALLSAACADTSSTARPAGRATDTPSSIPVPSVAPTPTSPPPSAGPSRTIEQPAPPEGIGVAPDAARVDLAVPAFSHSTVITNRLFPISEQASVLMLGHVEGKPFRTEVTLLPYTRIVEWQGQRVETLVSQYVAYLDGRITEVAYDLYAQADDWSVWYFGEDVFDFRDGAIVTTEGTWIAGRDGPAAMIMPGQPKVGDVYRPENAPGLVFEEVTVTAVDRALDGPLGPIAGGLVASELHADGATEDKIFAPGYGEFLTGGGGDLEALAMAVPIDALAGAVPGELRSLTSGAEALFRAAPAGQWSAASTTVRDMTAAWQIVRAGRLPKPIVPLLNRGVTALAHAVATRSVAGARQAAIDVARLALDLQLRYRPATEIDLARFDLWAAQLLVDAAANDAAAVNSDVFTLDYIRDRFQQTLDAATATRLNTGLGDLQVAVVDDDLDAAAEAAGRLRDLLRGVLPTN